MTLRHASTNVAAAQAIRDGFGEVRNALALVNQGERLRIAQQQISQLSNELEVSLNVCFAFGDC